ncbi:MAG: twitching motility protein [Pseudomonadota bacterium]|jgi:twitching motility protein PilT
MGDYMSQAVELTYVFAEAVRQGASDIHLGSHEPPMYRLNGVLTRAELPRVSDSQLRAWLMELVPAAALEQDAFDGVFEFMDLGRFRINLFRHQSGIAAALRVVPSVVPRLDTLGLPPVIDDVSRYERGLVLITGPTGSGKSTTLAAIVDHINSIRAAHIITVEDPIEFVHTSRQSLIRQRQLGRDAESFPGALRSMLREDPDVIVVGELRDRETIQLALTAAETGHLVLATLHSADAPRTIHRIVDVFPAERQNQIRSMLAESLQVIVSQAMRPCPRRGRIVEAEVLIAIPAVRTLIRDGKLHQLRGVMQASRAVGMSTFEEGKQGVLRHDL